MVILGVRSMMSKDAFNTWGWRIPFILSIFLVGVSVYIRSKMKESPLFTKLKSEGKTSSTPLKDSFGNSANWKVILLVLFGAAAGQAVVWYTGQFYVNAWLKTALKIDAVTSDTVVALALLAGMPFFVVFGALSDMIGRKKIMMAGNLIAAIFTYPIFKMIQSYGGTIVESVDAAGKVIVDAAGKPVMIAKDPNTLMIGVLIWVLVIFVTMVYGPIAAFLVESFPAKIRYSSVSLPYHIGNGYFGGFLPLIATAMVARTGNIFAGLWFPIAVATMTFIIGTLWLKETNHLKIHHE